MQDRNCADHRTQGAEQKNMGSCAATSVRRAFLDTAVFYWGFPVWRAVMAIPMADDRRPKTALGKHETVDSPRKISSCSGAPGLIGPGFVPAMMCSDASRMFPVRLVGVEPARTVRGRRKEKADGGGCDRELAWSIVRGSGHAGRLLRESPQSMCVVNAPRACCRNGPPGKRTRAAVHLRFRRAAVLQRIPQTANRAIGLVQSRFPARPETTAKRISAPHQGRGAGGGCWSQPPGIRRHGVQDSA